MLSSLGLQNNLELSMHVGMPCLERTFSFRAQLCISITGKTCCISKYQLSLVTSPTSGDTVMIRSGISFRALMNENKLDVIGHVTAGGYGPCYTCGYGHNCEAGGAVTEKTRMVGHIEKEDYPLDFCDQKATKSQICNVAELLKNRLMETA